MAENLYTPSWWDTYVTGMDWGTDRCLRNSIEAYVCFSEMMYNNYSIRGWDKSLVDHLIRKAGEFRGNSNLTTPAIDFWKSIQKNFLKWIRKSDTNIRDLPQFDFVLRQIDASTNNSFDYDEVRKEADRILQNTAVSTVSDIWAYWQELPLEVRIIGYIILGGTAITYGSPVIKGTIKIVSLPFKLFKILRNKES